MRSHTERSLYLVILLFLGIVLLVFLFNHYNHVSACGIAVVEIGLLCAAVDLIKHKR